MFAEMLARSDEKIFLEAIDQFFEQDSSIDYSEKDDFSDINLEIKKMNDKFYHSLEEEDCCSNLQNVTKDTSTEMDSEEFQQNINVVPKKKLFLHDFLIINQENINKTKCKVFQDYCSKLVMIEKFRNVWKDK
jgi:hypothetical protein